jgi:hypothetical protein
MQSLTLLARFTIDVFKVSINQSINQSTPQLVTLSAEDMQAASDMMCSLAEDKLERYGWLFHDGRNFGEHELVDRRANLILYSSFIKHNHTTSSVCSMAALLLSLASTGRVDTVTDTQRHLAADDLKRGGSWANRFTGQPMHGGLSPPISLFWYISLPLGMEADQVLQIKGVTKKVLIRLLSLIAHACTSTVSV